jgi:tetratricopeptide (TPR) repeat protein
LRDLLEPERVFQLVHPDLPAEFPKLHTVPPPWHGAAIAAVIALAVLILFPLATGAAELSPRFLDPRSLLTNLTALVVLLSTLQEHILLALSGLLLAMTTVAAALWRRGGRVAPGRWGGLLRFAGQRVGFRAVSFLTVATLAVFGAYLYQQYQWRVALPIPDGALGVALTRPAAAASLHEELAYALQTEGPEQEVVIREFPVNFDVRDIGAARGMGRRIGAEAVLIYREREGGVDRGRYVAYIVFTDPDVSWVIGQRSTEPTPGDADADPAATLAQRKPGVMVPALATERIEEVFTELVSAAAGIVAYHEGSYRSAIAHLERAQPDDPEAPSTGIIAFYRGSAYKLAFEEAAAAAAYEQAVTAFEARETARGQLSSQDLLLLVQALFERGTLAVDADEWGTAITWYERAAARYDNLSRATGELAAPTEVRSTFARLFAGLADAYRFEEQGETERRWRTRAEDELAALQAAAGSADDDAAVRIAEVRFALGDCVGAANALEQILDADPDNTNARALAVAVRDRQLRSDSVEFALEHLRRWLELRPDDVRVHLLLARFLGGGDVVWVSSDLADRLDEAEEHYRLVLAQDPANAEARQGLANVFDLRASLVGYPSLPGDLGPKNPYEDPISVAVTEGRRRHGSATNVDRQVASVDLLTAALDQQRIVVELRPTDVSAQRCLLGLYQRRVTALAWLAGIRLYEPPAAGIAFTPAAYSVLTSPRGDGEQARPDPELFRADLAEIRRLADQLLAPDSTASPTERLDAWALRLWSIGAEWRWEKARGQDRARTEALANEYRSVLDEARAVADAPVAEGASLDPLIFLQATIAGAAFDLGLEAEADATTVRVNDLVASLESESFFDERPWIHRDTFCAEEREVHAAQELLYADDFDGAAERYEAALAIDPTHVDALLDLSWVRYLQGDLPGAIDAATAVARYDADRWPNLANLAVYHLAAGDQQASLAALEQLFADLAAAPPADWGYVVSAGIADVHSLGAEGPEVSSGVRTLLLAYAGFLDAGGREAQTDPVEAAWYGRFYAQLGEALLGVGDPAGAEPLLQRALELEPHQPAARAALALAVLVEDRSAAAEIAAALAEVRDPFWDTVADVVGRDELLNALDEEIAAYLSLQPEEEKSVVPLVEALEAARLSDQPAS